ncbi:MAG: SDR family oxidoreductase [Dehalococcoidia bacterium]|nr:SDR family oxidoreductase [Dehalococcoidia bacterium]
MVLEQLRLDGKVAVVTGAGRGLGRQMALALAAAGADVVCAARTAEQIERTATDVTALGRRAVAQPTDVRDSAQCDRLIGRAVDAFGRIDIMLSNAGIGDARGMSAEFWDVTDEDWRDTIDVNLSSAFYCARAASRQLVAEGHGGVIINVASGTAMRANPTGFAYGAAKAGVIALTKSLSAMLGKYDIRCNCIIPGFVAQAPPRSDEQRAFSRARGRYLPAQRLGEAWELGPLAIFLASDASSYVNGQGFVIDGGGLAGGVAPMGFAPDVAG